MSGRLFPCRFALPLFLGLLCPLWSFGGRDMIQMSHLGLNILPSLSSSFRPAVGLYGNHHLLIIEAFQGSCTYKFTVVVTACTKSVHAWTVPSPNVEGEVDTEDHSLLGKELMATESSQERKFSLRVWSLVSWWCSGGRPHIQDCINSTNWTSWVKEKRAYRVGWMRAQVNTMRTQYMKISKN